VVRYAFRPLRPFPAGKPIEVVAKRIPGNHHDRKIVSEVAASVKLLRIVKQNPIRLLLLEPDGLSSIAMLPRA
jgi:hypothetical protein